MLSLLSSSSTPSSLLIVSSLSKNSLFHKKFTKAVTFFTSTMSINLKTHAFAGNPIRTKTPKATDPVSPTLAFETLKTQLLEDTNKLSSLNFMVLPFRKGRPLASSSSEGSNFEPNWNLGWISLDDCNGLLGNYGGELSRERFVYLGSKADEDVVFWAIDVSGEDSLVPELGGRKFCFVELRTLMVATDWGNEVAMSDLAIAGHARALLEWHNIAPFCGFCGSKTVPMEARKMKQCSNEICGKRVYPRVDPVVIMLVIDKENDRALLSRQSRFVPRMWSCLAGFIEPGESLEEAVRRETWEETGVEVGEVVYHSSQPWPDLLFREEHDQFTFLASYFSFPCSLRLICFVLSVGPNSMPCQLMVGFFAYAKSLEINVDKEELEDAQWHSREDVKKALMLAEYKKAQRTAAAKVEQMCRGVEKGQSLSADFNVESGELATMFIPGPFAIAHHLISSWVNQGSTIGLDILSKQRTGSNL